MSPGGVALVLTGATGTGKKEVGLELARRLGAEVIGLDSVKVYQGLSVGAATPSAADGAGVPIHLVGVTDPRHPFSLGEYVTAASKAVGEIRERSALPLFVGGTPLYLQALLRGLFLGPPAQPELRRRLWDEAQASGVERLHAKLSEVDPEAAARILPRDFKRISRALEVHAVTGRPISELQRQGTQRPIWADFRVAGLFCEEGLLRRRQRERVARMFEQGLVEEVRELHLGGRLQGEAAVAIGYREVVAHLEGRLTRQEAGTEIVRSTWRLTRNQRKWFRRFPEIAWIERFEESPADELLGQVLSAWRL
ncbi:MAG: tRNA (adenosine(37)-N6)-dimethylallyltransferase MiaA [Planctomycetota bacterium]